jgi:hypothetical protein
MVVLVATSGETLLKPGTYPAIIVEVAEKERDGRKFLVWTFEVKYSGSKTTRVRKPTSMAFGPKSAARSIVEAALGRKVRDGEQIDTDDLLGCRSRWSSPVAAGRTVQKPIRSRRFCRSMTRTTCRSEQAGGAGLPRLPHSQGVTYARICLKLYSSWP